MAYSLSTPLRFVKGIGPSRAHALAEQGFHTVNDILVLVPLRYEDRSTITTIADAPLQTLVSLQATVISVKQSFGRVRYTRAQLKDQTGSLTAIWFNNRFVGKNLKPGETYVFSGKINEKNTLTQPTYESASLAPEDHIHTSRLVPVYSATLPFPTTQWRRLLKEITDNLECADDVVFDLCQKMEEPTLSQSNALKILHFPNAENDVVLARERLALEELLMLIRHSQQMQEKWKSLPGAVALSPVSTEISALIPPDLPFALTNAQKRSIREILENVSTVQPMNRLLMGDVGSGKTIVAGIVAEQFIEAGHSVALIAPTRILAEQHMQSLSQNLPNLPTQLVLGGKKASTHPKKSKEIPSAKLYLGTHAVLNSLETIQPKLIIYDEQHRFGVKHRSQALSLTQTPHILTMTATPIPRTLLLTIFAHLQVSHLDELPANRLPTQTWVLPEHKRKGIFDWIQKQVELNSSGTAFQTLIVCPFIEKSESPMLADIAAAKPLFEALQATVGHRLRIGLLHGKQPKNEQSATLNQLREHQLDLVVATTIVEVGVDLPQASLMIIESAERYGLASLHQLRGRVGRAGQQGYCALFYAGKNPPKRLDAFAKTTNGQELAELDLEKRGAGDLFGIKQSGFDQLQFATWTNVTLIHLAQQISKQLPSTWQSVITPKFSLAEDILSN